MIKLNIWYKSSRYSILSFTIIDKFLSLYFWNEPSHIKIKQEIICYEIIKLVNESLVFIKKIFKIIN